MSSQMRGRQCILYSLSDGIDCGLTKAAFGRRTELDPDTIKKTAAGFALTADVTCCKLALEPRSSALWCRPRSILGRHVCC